MKKEINLTKLNIGCGIKKLSDYLNLDFYSEVKPDVVHDLNKFPWPFKNDQFAEVFASHTLEHLDNLPKIMAEIWRISKKDAIIKVIVPYFAYVGAFKDPTHKHFFTWQTMDYFDISETTLGHYSTPKFKVVNKKLKFGLIHRFFGIEFLANKFPYLYEHYFVYFFPGRELYFELLVVK